MTNKKSSQVYEGEIVPPKKKKNITVQEVRFAKLLEEGVDPVEAADKVSNVGKVGIQQPGKKPAKLKKKANELMKACQDKMLVDVSKMAPKALKKLESMMYAKEDVYWQGQVVGKKNALETQRKAAQSLVDMAKPTEKDRLPSLVAQVIQINK